MPRVDKRFWSSTRGRVLNLLRKSVRSVNDLAEVLGLTPNAVRSHLTALERDGLVVPSGVRRGPRKPTITYELSPEAAHLFPRAYGPVVQHLLDALRAAVSAQTADQIIQAAGHSLAEALFPAGSPVRTGSPVERGVAALRDLGGCCEPQNGNGHIKLACSDCPLGQAAEGHPEICRLVETILADVVEVPVRLECQPNPPRCRFELDWSGDSPPLNGSSRATQSGD